MLSGWTPIQPEVKIAHNLETTPLQIKTDSTVGSDEEVRVYFSNASGWTSAGFNLYFSSPPQYYLHYCSRSETDFPSTLPSEAEKVWEITKLSGPRITIICNGVKVLDILISDETCKDSRWRTTWRRDVGKIDFGPFDTASDFYRPSPGNLFINHWCYSYLRYGVAV